MATKYWVGGSGNWSDTAHWATSSGGAGSTGVPVAADTIVTDTLSNAVSYTITINTAAVGTTFTIGDPLVGAVSFVTDASKTRTLTMSGNMTVAATLTITGNSATNRLLVQSSVLGTARTITATAVSLSNIIFMDIAGAGAAAPFTGTTIGDAGGNSGITFTTAADQYFYASTTGTKPWSTAGNWFLGSGGTGGAGRVPLPQDNAIINSASIAAGAAGSTSITMDMLVLGKDINFSGVTSTPSFNGTSWTPWILGSLTFGTLTSAIGGAGGTMRFLGRGSHTHNFNGVAVNYGVQTYLGTHTLAAALACDRVAVGSGTFATGGYSVTAGQLWDEASATAKTINLGASTITLTGDDTSIGRVWGMTGTGTTFNCGTSTIKLTSTTGGAKTFLSKTAQTYYNVWFATSVGINRLNSGSSTFNNIKVDPGLVLQNIAGTTTTAASYTIDGRASTGTDAPSVYFDGQSGSFISLPDSAAISVTGDIAVVFDGVLASWTSISQTLASKYGNAGNLSFTVDTGIGSGMRIVLSPDGSGVTSAICNVAIPFSAGARGGLAVTRVAATGVVQFWKLVSGTWSRLGADQATTAGGIFDGTMPLEIGSRNGGLSSQTTGHAISVKLYSGIPTEFGGAGGTLVADMNPALYTGSGSTMPDGADGTKTWTRNGNAQFTATNRTTLMGLTNATYTLAKSGGGTVAIDYLSVRNATASPTNTFYGYHASDGGGNVNWIWAAALGAAGAEAVATGAVGAPGVAMTVAAPGGAATGTGAAGVVLPAFTLSMPGISAAAAVSAPAVSVTVGLPGTSATGAYSAPAARFDAGLVGVLATGTAGAVSLPVNGIVIREASNTVMLRAKNEKVFLRSMSA